MNTETATESKPTRVRKPKAIVATDSAQPEAPKPKRVRRPTPAQVDAIIDAVEASEAASEPTIAPEPVSAPAVRSAHDVGNVLASGGKTIGAICFWTLSDITVSRADVRAKMDELGLLPAVLRDPSPSALLTRACAEVKRGRGSLVFDRVIQNKTETVFAMSERAIDGGAEKATYSTQSRVRVANVDGSIQLEDSSNPLMMEVRAKYALLQENMTVYEFGEMLGRAFLGRAHSNLLGGINLRGKAGGVYFVPQDSMAKTLAFADFINSTGSCNMTVWPVAAGDRQIKQAQSAIERDIQTKVRNVMADLSEFGSKLDKEALESIGFDTRGIQIRMERFELLQAKASLYADVLGSAQADIASCIGKAKDSLRTAVLGRDFGAFDGFSKTEDDDTSDED